MPGAYYLIRLQNTQKEMPFIGEVFPDFPRFLILVGNLCSHSNPIRSVRLSIWRFFPLVKWLSALHSQQRLLLEVIRCILFGTLFAREKQATILLLGAFNLCNSQLQLFAEYYTVFYYALYFASYRSASVFSLGQLKQLYVSKNFISSDVLINYQ